MWSLMLATVVASLVSNYRSAAKEVARFTRASQYSGGGWVLLGWCYCKVASEASLFGYAKLVTEKTLCALEMRFEVGPCFFIVGFSVPGFAVFEIQPSFENKGVRDVEELVGRVWLAAVVSIILTILELLDEAVKRAVGVPECTHFRVVIF